MRTQKQIQALQEWETQEKMKLFPELYTMDPKKLREYCRYLSQINHKGYDPHFKI